MCGTPLAGTSSSYRSQEVYLDKPSVSGVFKCESLAKPVFLFPEEPSSPGKASLCGLTLTADWFVMTKLFTFLARLLRHTSTQVASSVICQAASSKASNPIKATF